MINEITLIGFKSFLNRTLDLNQLTILAGLNSSGKSSVIQALVMMERAKTDESAILIDGHGSVDELKNIYTKDPIEIIVKNTNSGNFELRLDSSVTAKFFNSEGEEYPEIIYISANRFGPKVSLPIFSGSEKRNKIGPNGENLFQFIDEYAYEPVDERLRHPNSEGDTVQFNLSGWLSEICPNVKFTYQIDKISDSSYGMFNAYRSTNVGFGISYSLSVISSLLISTLIPNCLLIIENPEAHLHPKGQTALARLISLCAEVGTQVIIETHSDHIFDGIRLLVKEMDGFNEKVQAHWFELDSKDLTDVVSPKIDENGRLDEWPEGMFDQFEKNASALL